jgi:hypothetical protein
VQKARVNGKSRLVITHNSAPKPGNLAYVTSGVQDGWPGNDR